MSDPSDMFKKLVRDRSESQPLTPKTEPAIQEETKKRGRPATGKRSDSKWIGRTFYIQRETDLDVEDELLHLKRRGIELDKSELADALLAAWVKWRKGEDSEFLLSEISPRRKGDEK